MARKCRIEFPDACYHVINRGNYRSDIFASPGAKGSFEECLFEACRKSNWRLHAYVAMINHFHFAVQTPQANLVAGMHWLESTFANRFNRYRGEHGHLFQGRYKAILLEPGTALGAVCDYIHLNPVRAHAATIGHLHQFRHSSYWYLHRPHARPPFLRITTALQEAGDIPDTRQGRRTYAEYLAWQVTDGPMADPAADDLFCSGWALGCAEFLEGLRRDHEPSEENRAWEAGGAREIREARWMELLRKCQDRLGPAATQPFLSPKGAPWKVAIAAFLKRRTQVPNAWLAAQLHMGSPARVSYLVGEAHKRSSFVGPWLRLLETDVRP